MPNTSAKNNRFIFQLSGYRELSWNVQASSFAGLNLGSTPFPTRNVDLMIPSNKIDFGPHTVRILVSENFKEWLDVVRWMYEITKTNDAHLSKSYDGVLIVMNANNTPILEVTYLACAPINTTEITQDMSDDELVTTFDLTMTFDAMKIRIIETGEEIVYGE